MLPGYPHAHHPHVHPSQAIDHGYASNPYLGAGRYPPPPPHLPAAYYAMPGVHHASGLSSGLTSASHTPISSFGSGGTPASASTNSLRAPNGGPASETSAATTTVQQHTPVPPAPAGRGAGEGPGSAYAQYLAAATAHSRKLSGSYVGFNGYDQQGPAGFTDATHHSASPATAYGAPGGGRNGRHGNGGTLGEPDLASGPETKGVESLDLFAGASSPNAWRK